MRPEEWAAILTMYALIGLWVASTARGHGLYVGASAIPLFLCFAYVWPFVVLGFGIFLLHDWLTAKDQKGGE